MSIPKIIHQTWKDYNIPYDIYKKEWVDSWKEYHPAWKFMFWTDDDLRNLIKEDYSWFLSTYDAYEYNICRVDAARYFIMHKYGGLYIDLDFECFKKFDDILSYDLILGNCKLSPGMWMRQLSIPNALMMSRPAHSLWEVVFLKMQENFDNMHKIKNSSKTTKVFLLTGPALLYYSILYYRIIMNKKDIWVTPKNYFYPDFEPIDSYAKTYWTGVWYKKMRE